jgi:glycosyltransferase involved in cell wall biosynthesis
MHIGIVAPCSSGPLADLLPESGGVDLGWGAYFIAALVRALIRRGHRVSVVTLSPELAENRILKGPKLTYYVYPTRLRRRMRDLYKVEREGLREGIRLAKPDLLHAHWTYEFALASLETGLPTLVTSHDNAFQVLRFTRDLYRVGRLYLQIRVIRKALFMTAVSPYVAHSHRWLAKTEIEVVPNPIEVHKWLGYKGNQSSGAVRIATVLNGWGELKNPQAAIKAFALLRCELPDAEMFMYGTDFEDGETASQWAASKGLSQNIHFCGFLSPSDLQRQLKEMSILLHPSLEEACPMTLLEAMALGLPIVAGDKAGGVPWVLDEGRAGFLTDVRNPTKIAQTMLTCIQDVEERNQKQQNAYDRVMRLFSPSSVAEKYEKMYEKVLSRY